MLSSWDVIYSSLVKQILIQWWDEKEGRASERQRTKAYHIHSSRPPLLSSSGIIYSALRAEAKVGNFKARVEGSCTGEVVGSFTLLAICSGFVADWFRKSSQVQVLVASLLLQPGSSYTWRVFLRE